MNTVIKDVGATKAKASENLNLGAAIMFMLLMLLFIIIGFYILVSSYLQIH